MESPGHLTFVDKENGSTVAKRDVRLVDKTDQSVTLGLWGEEAKTIDFRNHPVLAVKEVKVCDHEGMLCDVR